MDRGASLTFIGHLAESIGVTEPAFRLLISLLLGYPISLFHRQFLYGKAKNIQHLFFIIIGLGLGYFNFGNGTAHSVFSVIFSYLTIVFLRGTTACVVITFLFNMSYLLIGYHYSATNDYDINWTLPQCVLVLRLIGLSYDVYDGAQPEGDLSASSKNCAQPKRPGLLEYCGHMFFPASFLVGPQFPLKRYQDFVDGRFNDGASTPPTDCVMPAAKRFGLGLLYLSIYQVVGMHLSDDYITSPEFADVVLWKRIVYVSIWARVTLYKYISCWLLTEGACILIGLTHNGKDANGVTRWDGVANVDIVKFENATEFNHYIQSFNLNTNFWVAQYVYKRLKFLGNRYISQLAALVFLAIWHGFHSGYYMSFFFEFIVMFLEKDVHATLAKNPHVKEFFSTPMMKTVLYAALKLYTFVFMGWCFAPFALLTFGRYWKVLQSLDYIGFIFFLPWPLVYAPVFRYVCKATRPRRDD